MQVDDSRSKLVLGAAGLGTAAALGAGAAAAAGSARHAASISTAFIQGSDFVTKNASFLEKTLATSAQQALQLARIGNPAAQLKAGAALKITPNILGLDRATQQLTSTLAEWSVTLRTADDIPREAARLGEQGAQFATRSAGSGRMAIILGVGAVVAAGIGVALLVHAARSNAKD